MAHILSPVGDFPAWHSGQSYVEIQLAFFKGNPQTATFPRLSYGVGGIPGVSASSISAVTLLKVGTVLPPPPPPSPFPLLLCSIAVISFFFMFTLLSNFWMSAWHLSNAFWISDEGKVGLDWRISNISIPNSCLRAFMSRSRNITSVCRDDLLQVVKLVIFGCEEHCSFVV